MTLNHRSFYPSFVVPANKITPYRTVASSSSSVCHSKESIKELSDMLEEFEFRHRYEKTGKERFVQYEAKDKDWAEFFGFIRKVKKIVKIIASPDLLDDLKQRHVMPFGNNQISKLYGIPVEGNHAVEPDSLLLLYDDGRMGVVRATKEQLLNVLGSQIIGA